MLFVAGKLRLSADSRFRLGPFASTTLNHKLKTVFPSTGATNPFCVLRCFVVRNFRVSEPKTDFLCLTLPGNFRVVTFQSKTGRFVARNFSRTRGKSDLRREATQGACPAPPPPRAKKKTTAAPSRPSKHGEFHQKRWSFRGTSVVTFMKTRGTFSPARLKVI